MGRILKSTWRTKESMMSINDDRRGRPLIIQLRATPGVIHIYIYLGKLLLLNLNP